MILPSSYLAYELVAEEVFRTKATSYVNDNFNFKNTSVSQVNINPKNREIRVFLIGDHIAKDELNNLTQGLNKIGLQDSYLKIFQNGERGNIDISVIKANIMTDLYKNSQVNNDAQNIKLASLQEHINEVSKEKEYYKQIPKELVTIFPKVKNAVLSRSFTKDPNNSEHEIGLFILNCETKKKLSKKEIGRVEEWLKMRLSSDKVMVLIR